jgi:RNA recognition motif-containing protein
MTAIYSVEVSNIAPTTTKETLHEFFTFCGKINDISIKGGDTEKSATKTATVTFEKANAVKTAQMLNGGALDGSNITVTSDKEHVDEHNNSGHPIDQESKPRAGIAAEYLAKGYQLSDSILQRAIEIDQKQGISTRFLEYIKALDQGVGSRTLGPDRTVSGKFQETITRIDEQRGIRKQAESYYAKAIQSPFGQKVYAFYSTTSKQVLDIHEEARRIATQHKAASSTEETAAAPAEASASAAPQESEKSKVQ